MFGSGAITMVSSATIFLASFQPYKNQVFSIQRTRDTKHVRQSEFFFGSPFINPKGWLIIFKIQKYTFF